MRPRGTKRRRWGFGSIFGFSKSWLATTENDFDRVKYLRMPSGAIGIGGGQAPKLVEGDGGLRTIMRVDIWQAPSLSCPALRGGAVHVWRAQVGRQRNSLALAEQFLSAEEQVRTAEYRWEEDRARFVIGRAMLRALVGRYTHRPAQAIELVFNSHGKPALLPSQGEGDIQFNLAHSGDWVLIALARGRAVGVDVEHIRPLPDFEGIAARFFAPVETAALAALPGAERLPAFFRCWACKEAYVKALGQGLVASLKEFEVSFGPGEPARLLSGGLDGKPWSLHELRLGPDYAAALVVEGEAAAVHGWDWVEV
jgi:4'-phosphopantetheinyl transferase